MIAIGELQRHTGADRRVTARASILGENTPQPHVLGVWDSWGENASRLSESSKARFHDVTVDLLTVSPKGHQIIECVINGQPARMILDTAGGMIYRPFRWRYLKPTHRIRGEITHTRFFRMCWRMLERGESCPQTAYR